MILRTGSSDGRPPKAAMAIRMQGAQLGVLHLVAWSQRHTRRRHLQTPNVALAEKPYSGEFFMKEHVLAEIMEISRHLRARSSDTRLSIKQGLRSTDSSAPRARGRVFDLWRNDISCFRSSRIENSLNKLSSVLEREESPHNQLHSINEMLSPPVAPPNTCVVQSYAMPGSFDTPPPAHHVYPGLEEMHPSKVHHSTIKEPALIDATQTAPATNAVSRLIESTPSKTRGSLPAHMSSPGFDFSFTRPESDLSEEAQKIMDSVREEAARIKASMQAEREKQVEKEGEAKHLSGIEGRKIAQPRSGRYSDVHKQQFKKMESIASHVSTWKTKIQNSVTAPTMSSSLKRSNSKAGLDKPDSGTPSAIPRSKSFKAMPPSFHVSASPGKRVKRDHDDDTSKTRPVSRDTNDGQQATPLKKQPVILPSAISTPTKASLARSASVKAKKTSLIPSMSRSASFKTLGTPQTEGSKKYMSQIAKFSPVKSILHRSQPKFSEDPVKVAAGTHLPLPKTKPFALDKELPSLPDTPSKEPVKKQVNFSSSTKPVRETHTPSKIPRSDSMKAIDSPNVTHRNASKIPNSASAGIPGEFTFSSSKTINFGPATSGLTRPSSSVRTSTIRPVRPSGFPTPLAESAFENHMREGGIAHGIANKKRKHDGGTDDEGEEKENEDPKDGEEGGSPSKRVKVGDAEGKVGKKAGKKGKGIMSLGRLQALSRPKGR
ncbi:MAG: hypothetical protein Q9170_007877 [Blastenia crenularia]